MGVYHISGLGLSPGALTMPLTVIYLLQIAQLNGDEKAAQFFSSSGELKPRSGSKEELHGVPEYLIVLTSEEVIKGAKKLRYRSNWFGIPKTVRAEPADRFLRKFFDKLREYFRTEFGEEAVSILEKLKGIYLLKVQHNDFEDCFLKAGVTLKALGSMTLRGTMHEIWANMVAGTNQINSAILMAGAYTAAVSRYYYLPQSFENSDLLEPEWVEKPKGRIPTELLLQRWNELPVFSIDIGPILLKISELFQGREIVNIGEFEEALKEEIEKLRLRESSEIWFYSDRTLNRQFLAKLVGRVIVIEGSKVAKGPLFDKIVGIWKKIDLADIKNFEEWKGWAESNGILHEVEL